MNLPGADAPGFEPGRLCSAIGAAFSRYSADARVSPKGSAGRNGELSTIAFDQKRNVRVAYFDVNKLSDIGAKTAASGVSGAANAMLKAIRITAANSRELDVSHAIMIKKHTRATKRKPTSGKDDLGI